MMVCGNSLRGSCKCKIIPGKLPNFVKSAPNYFYSLTRRLQVIVSKSGHLQPRYGCLKFLGSKYSFMYIIVVGTVWMVLVTCRVVNSDQIWGLWSGTFGNI